jgi:hypothetical protein
MRNFDTRARAEVLSALRSDTSKQAQPVDGTGERNIASQIAFCGADRSAQRRLACLRLSM